MTFSQIFGKFTFIVELLLAQSALLYSYPKRSRFALRLTISYAVCIAASAGLYCIPYFSSPWFVVLHLVRMLVILALTVAVACVCYDCKFGAVFSACIGGEAVQHIGYHCAKLVSLLPFLPEMNVYTEFVCCVLAAGVACLVVGRAAKKYRYYENYDRRMISVAVIIVFLCLGIVRLWQTESLTPSIIAALCVYAIACNALALFIQYFMYRFATVASANITLQRIGEERERQYELSKENIELLNQKCHDLKHKLLALGDKLPPSEIESMKETIAEYDGFVRTGNAAFDTVVNEKMRRCRRERITLTCMGDGRALDFMEVMDIYSLFGNALDNAVEATEGLSDPGRRQISVVVEKRGGFVNVSVLNYTDGKGELPEGLPEGLPETTKTAEPGYHGFGLKSIRATAEKYGGDIAVSRSDGVFRLNIFLLDGGKGKEKKKA